MSPQLPEPYEALAIQLRDAADGLDASPAASAVHHATRRRRLARWARGHLPVVIIGAVALSGTAAATVSVLKGEPSKPMRGQVLGEASEGAQRYKISVRPGSAVGLPAWCVSTTVNAPGTFNSATGCLPARDREFPLLAGGLSGGDERGHDMLFGQVTTDEVAAIELPTGRRVLTRKDAALPDGLRIAVAVFDKHELWRLRHPRTPRPSRASAVVPLDAEGRALRAEDPAHFNPSVEQRKTDGVLDLPGTQCGFKRAGGLSGLGQARLTVPAKPLPKRRDLAGAPLVACAQLTIGETKTVLPRTATIYVDANDPGSTPEWPGARRKPSGRIYSPGSDEPAPSPREQLIERRGQAWLAVDGASPGDAFRLMRELDVRVDVD